MRYLALAFLVVACSSPVAAADGRSDAGPDADALDALAVATDARPGAPAPDAATCPPGEHCRAKAVACDAGRGWCPAQ